MKRFLWAGGSGGGAGRLVVPIGLIVASLGEALTLLPDPENRVSFARHGGDWTQGNCGSRNLQSPITLNELYVPATGDFSYFYRDFTDSFNFYNDGRTLWADLAGKNVGFVSLPFAAAPRYDLYRIDVHSPSEHTLRGEHAALEIQLVHQPASGPPGKQLVTVSLLFNCSNPPHLERMRKLYPGFLQTRTQLETKREAIANYEPSSAMSGFNPDLQAFVRDTPPVFQDFRAVQVPKSEPLRLGRWLEGATFATYRGSQTLPPCKENMVWLVRRDPIQASDEQVSALFLRLFETSDGFGTYRTVMPVNQRPIMYWTAKAEVPIKPVRPARGMPSSKELRVMSEDAITIAKAASDYARDMNARLAQAAVAQQEDWSASTGPTAPPLVMGAAPVAVTPPPPPGGPEGDIWAARQIGEFVKRAVNEAVAHDLKEIVPAATNLATGYVRRALLKAAGYPTTMTTTTPPPPPPPGATPPGLSVAGGPFSMPIIFTMMVLNVDYAMLVANPATLAAFVLAVKSAVLAQLGSGLSLGDLTLTLSPGSVIVTVAVKVPFGTDSTLLMTKIAQSAGSIASSVSAAFIANSAVVAVSPGGPPKVGHVSAPTQTASIGGSAPSPGPMAMQPWAPGPAAAAHVARAPAPVAAGSRR